MRLEGGLRRVVLLAAPWVAVVLLWYAVRASGLVKAELVPSPGQVLEQFWRMLTTQRLWLDMYMSFQRVVLGVTLGIAGAVPVGFLLGWYRPVRLLVDPLLNFFRALPPIALIPLVIAVSRTSRARGSRRPVAPRRTCSCTAR